MERDRIIAATTPLIAALLTIPLAQPIRPGFELNPAFLLAPLIGVLYFVTIKDRLNLLFALATLCGAVSIVAAHVMAPDNLRGNIAELLLWTLFAPSFIFLGRELPARKVIVWLAIWSSVFLIAVTLPLLASGEAVRAVDNAGRSYVNVQFLGWPVYATFGVNSIAALFFIQAALLCAGLYLAPRLQVMFALGLACAVFLIIGSNSRAAALATVLLGLTFVWYALRSRSNWRPAALVPLSLAVAFTVTGFRDMPESRLVESIEIAFAVGSDTGARATETQRQPEDLTTGRRNLASVAIREWLQSPLVGNGFSGYGRFDARPLDGELARNTTSHFYPLTLLWKGGILFFVSFAGFVGLALVRAWRNIPRGRPEWIFPAAAVAMAFAYSLTWDILMIPSAGALAWLLLGNLGRARNEL